MKRALKRILPILLVIVVLCSITWYLFVYDREFTRDFLMDQARYFDANGNYSLASWLYNKAYYFADDKENVAIELAGKFIEQGNYTQAERTLSEAIADGGSAELYITLCNTYVEQNKLLDAVTMLDNIADPAIKAQLAEQRPAVPTVSHEPGFYSEYITVELAFDGGTLYTTTNGLYPSLDEASAGEAITLAAGDNTIYALVVGDNGLVSPLAIYGYTVGGVIEEITFTDDTLDAAVRELLDITAGGTIFSDQLWDITELELPTGADSYQELKHLPYLEKLTIKDSGAESLSGVEALSHLKELKVTGSILSSHDLRRIASLPALEKLTLAECSLSNIQGLANCKNLTYLDLSGNSIQDLTPLSFMTGLTELHLGHNALVSLNAISSLTNLVTLDVSYNSLVSVAPLASCTALKVLYIQNNTVETLDCAGSWPYLTILHAEYNQLSDISALAGCANLMELDVSNNLLTDISALGGLNNLEVLLFVSNQVTALPALDQNSSNLVRIDGSKNLIQTVANLAGLKRLNVVLMDDNKIKSVNALADCHNLIKVSVYNNPVTDVSALLDMGVIVYYTPKV